MASVRQLRHYALTALCFWRLHQARWLRELKGEQVLRRFRQPVLPFIPDGLAYICDGSVRRVLVVEVMASRRDYSSEKVAATLRLGWLPVFVVPQLGARAESNLRRRVGPLAAIVSERDFQTGHWAEVLRATWA